jgi:integrase
VALCDTAFGPPPPPCAGVHPDLAVVETRLAQFLTNDLASELPFETYHFKQQATVGRFVEFLQRRRPLVPWTTATPHDVVAFLISKDASSRTTVHSTLSCPNMGSLTFPFGPCDCPRRAKATSLKTTSAMLRAEFSREVSPLKYAPQTLLGNPVHSPLVERYIDLMEKAQTRAGVVVSQAVMISPAEFMAVMTLLSSLANDASLAPLVRLVYFMDACALSFQYAAGSRMGDLLSSLRASQVRVSAVSVGFRQQWGKTIRGFGRRRDFDLPVREQLVCPLRRFCEYVLAARALGIDLTQRDASDPTGSPLGFLFRQFDPVLGSVSSKPETYPRLQSRLRSYLERLQMFRGQTLHGIRSTHSVEAALRGISLTSIAHFVGWASCAMPHHYARLSGTMGTLASLLPTDSVSPHEYAQRMAADPMGLHRQALPLELYEMVASESHFVDIFSSL